MSFFRLIRLPNLLIVALVQCLLYFRLLLPAFQQNDIAPRLNTTEFICLVLATVFTTACGYILNDLYDGEMDMLNRKDKVVINVAISAQIGTWLYAILGFAGLMLSLYLAFRIGQIYMASLYLLSFALLFFYTVSLKKLPLAGNLLVAFFCLGVAALVWLAEAPGWWELKTKAPQSALALQSIFNWYFSFAFFSTFFREIVKDLEDKEGDAAEACRTYPIVAGEKAAKWLATAIAVLLIGLLLWQYLSQASGFNQGFYLGAMIGVVLPLAYSIQLLQKAQQASDYHRISFLAKMVMLAGILLLFFVNNVK